MSLASEFISIGIERAKATGQPCPHCAGTGVCTVGWPGLVQIGNGLWACECDAGDRRLDDYRARSAREHYADVLKAAQIPAKFAALDLSTFRQAVNKSVEKVKAHRLVSEWTSPPTPPRHGEGSKPWLFLYGKTGRGKTGLGVAALKALIGQGHVGEFVASFDMFTEMQSRFGGNVEEYTEALARVEVLMLDEIVPVQVTDWRRGVLFELLWRRDADQRPTIITTAVGTDVLIQAVTEAGWRRIRDNSVMVELAGNEINYGH